MEPADSTPAQSSWRASVPDATATDLENLMGTGLAAAQEQLERSGGFQPFALVVENDGDIRLVAVSPADPEADGDTEFDADGMIRDITELLRQHRDEFRAAAIVCDITLVEEDSDAIHVATEHRDGAVFAAVLPYNSPSDGDGEWEFGDVAADSNEPVIWAG